MSHCFLGIDAGGTIIKATLFSDKGGVVATAGRRLNAIEEKPSHVERDLASMQVTLAELILELLDMSSVNPSKIMAIGCAGHGNGLYCLDRNGDPLIGIQSTDSRAIKMAEEFAVDGRDGAIADISLQKPWPAQTPTILAALKRNQPDLYSQIGQILLCKDYVNYFLTGISRSDFSDMGGAGMLRLPANEYCPRLLDLYGIADIEGALPTLAHPHEVIGGVSREAAQRTGLSVGTPVVAGLFDVVANAVGSGALNVGEASIIAGTWSINQVVSADVRPDNSPFITCYFPGNASGARGGRFLNVEASATSASNYEWLVQTVLANPDASDAARARAFAKGDAALARTSPELSRPYFMPYLYGGDANPRAMAGFHNLASWHSRDDLIYAVCEGITFGHRRHLDTLRQKGFEINSAVITGGAVRSSHWTQMFADNLGLGVHKVACEEAGTLGAAMTAAVGTGAHADFAAAAAAMVKRREHFLPDAKTAPIAAQRLTRFNELVDTLTPLWDSWKT